MSSSGDIIVVILRPVPFPECASSNYKVTQTPHAHHSHMDLDNIHTHIYIHIYKHTGDRMEVFDAFRYGASLVIVPVHTERPYTYSD